MEDFTVSVDDLRFAGAGLVRPECVLCTRNGAIFTSDWRGGVARIGPDGRHELFTAQGGADAVKPNGIALQPDGSFLVTDLGETGGLYRLARDGTLTRVVRAADGVELPPSNYVLVDSRGRVWITVSTRRRPRALGYRPDADDGFIVLWDGRDARIVADGLGYTNEIGFDDTGRWLYVNETFARRVSRFRVNGDGSLSGNETVVEFGRGTFPDGLTFDAEGGIWITSIVSNRVIRISPDGEQRVVLEDSDPDHVAWVEEAYHAGAMGRPHMDTIKSRKLKNISSLAFGGPDLRTVYLGCLLGDRLATFRSPVAGRPPVHWDYDV